MQNNTQFLQLGYILQDSGCYETNFVHDISTTNYREHSMCIPAV